MKTAVILAGGLSRRMGYDKQLLIYRGQRLILEQVKKLSKHFSKIVIVTNNDLLMDLKFEYPVEFIKDLYQEKGPLGGIHAACKHVKGKFYLIACDMPIINLDYIKYMETFDHDGVITQRGSWIEPFNGIYSSNFTKYLEDFLNNNKRNIYDFLKSQDVYYIPEEKAKEFDPHWEMFKNINKTEDL